MTVYRKIATVPFICGYGLGVVIAGVGCVWNVPAAAMVWLGGIFAVGALLIPVGKKSELQ